MESSRPSCLSQAPLLISGCLGCLLGGCSVGREACQLCALLWSGQGRCSKKQKKKEKRKTQGKNVCSLGTRWEGSQVSCGYRLCPLVPPQSWADAFRSSPDLTGVVTIYEDLRRKGLEFPMTDLDMLSPIHTPQRVRELPHREPREGRQDSSPETSPGQPLTSWALGVPRTPH